MTQTKYRLGLDIGSTSIGWCALKLDNNNEPCGILGMGARIFSSGRDPKTGTSLAEDRRMARGMRRNRDRTLLRKHDLMQKLIANGLMPTDKAQRKQLESLCPYQLRSKGVKGELTLHELGRALFHLHQRRGFKSNRITDKGGDESGTIKVSIKSTREAIKKAKAHSYGDYLASLHKKRESVRARLRGSTQKDKRYDIYADRSLIEEEFETLWNTQKTYHPKTLTDTARESLHGVFFRQRPLRPVEPGKCRLDPTQARAPWALPLTQHFRIVKEVNNLYWYDSRQEKHELALDEKQRLITMLLEKKEVTFKAMKKALGIDDPEAYFNLESDKRKNLKGDLVAYAIANKNIYGSEWRGLDPTDQNNIVTILLDSTLSDGDAKQRLTDEHAIPEETAERLLTVQLPVSYCHYSEKVLAKLVPMMESQGLNEYNAIITADYTPPQEYDNKALPRLPYYGQVVPSAVIGATNDLKHQEIQRYGRINNPTVHIGLNQLRKLINALIKDKHFGKPEQIIVEFARDLKKSWEERREIERQQTENQKKNDERNKKIQKLDFTPNGANRMRMRLWEETDKKCIYTGKPIPLSKLFTKEIEDDHILPFSRTLDNSANNRLVCYGYANKQKGNQTPYEAFGNLKHSKDYDGGWDGILDRASQLRKERSKRFAPDAIERYKEEHDFIDRQLHDTAYLAKIAKGYLGKLYDNPLSHVWVSPGQMTALLRGKWGLNNPLGDNQFKDRNDHRHHAIDAFVVAATSRSMLQKVSTQAAKPGNGRLIADMPPPWEGYRDQFIQHFKKLVVSHKPDHSMAAQLHNETAYGKIKVPPGTTDSYNYVVRKNIADLTEGEVARIQDEDVRGYVQEHLAQSEGKPHKEALQALVDKQPNRERIPKRGRGQKPYVKKVRIHLPNKGGAPPPLIPIKDKQGKPYKYYDRGKNHCVDVYENEDGSIYAYTYSIFEANQLNKQGKWDTKHPHPLPREGKKPLMRVYKGDCLKVTINGDTQIIKVQKLMPSASRFVTVSHTDAGDFVKRVKDRDDAFKWIFIAFNYLKKYQARKVRVDMLGRVYHVQPPQP
ncbi:MAG: type II CRISPR RNA-guided endonuclease Cas9 [Alphaproteobacteria bacterium GM202ARS2]|nr:type II CRISPR RNA-guided endonuclease Cas9 [Alphaproteobacteria bacterium GM202ARS2]